MYCKHCGAEINDNAVVCIKCGCAVNDSLYTEKVLDPNVSDKDWLVTGILCLFFGYLARTDSTWARSVQQSSCFSHVEAWESGFSSIF